MKSAPFLRPVLIIFFISLLLPNSAWTQPPDLEGAFEKMEADLMEASASEVNEFAPETFNRLLTVFENAVNNFQVGDFDKAEKLLEEAGSLLVAARDAADRARSELGPMIQTRQAAFTCDYLQDAPTVLGQAENAFHTAIRLLENGQSREALREAQTADRRYREAVVKALQDGPIRDAQASLRANRLSLDPETYRNATAKLQSLSEELDSELWWEGNLKERIVAFEHNWNEIVVDFFPYPFPPDTLLMGEFKIVVERYNKRGYYSFTQKTFTGASGIGRIYFDCKPPFISPFPWWEWGYQDVIPATFTIVDKVRDPSREVAISDFQKINPAARPGDIHTIEIPAAFRTEITSALELVQTDDLYYFPSLGGIRVQFEEVTILPTSDPNTGRINSGRAWYPSDTAIPSPPVTLEIGNFTLEIDSLEMGPKATIARARLQLPDNISAKSRCEPAQLNLGMITIFPDCEFYREYPDENFGNWIIGDTRVETLGNGFVADFSSSKSYGPTGQVAGWKGVVLLEGETPKASPAPLSNTGYLQAGYTYTHATISNSGFNGTLWAEAYSYDILQPYGYLMAFDKARLSLSGSTLIGGQLYQGEVTLPNTSVLDAFGSAVAATFDSLSVQSDYDLFGTVLLPEHLRWGSLANPAEQRINYGVAFSDIPQGHAYFSARPQVKYMPLNPYNTDVFLELDLYQYTNQPAHYLEQKRMQGVTVLARMEALFVLTPDMPQPTFPIFDPLNPIAHKFGPLDSNLPKWLHFSTLGVNGAIHDYLRQGAHFNMGPTGEPGYLSGNTPFDVIIPDFTDVKEPEIRVSIQFVESAVIDSDQRGIIKLANPINDNLEFREMMFTSTAHNAGARVDLGDTLRLGYWGLDVVQRQPFSDAGLVSIKSGQIILTAAGLSEPVHWSQPFFLTWGEILATGQLGRLFFDFNGNGQQFDDFDFSTAAVRLTEVDDPNESGVVLTKSSLNALHPDYRVTATAITAMNNDGVPTAITDVLQDSILNDRIERYWDFMRIIEEDLDDVGVPGYDTHIGTIMLHSIEVATGNIQDTVVLRKINDSRVRNFVFLDEAQLIDTLESILTPDEYNSHAQTILNTIVLVGALEVAGNIHFPFFGAEYQHIIDFLHPARMGFPYFGRSIYLSRESSPGFEPSDLDLFARWADGDGEFDFTIDYSHVDQYGYFGRGTSDLIYLSGGSLDAAISLKADKGCITITPPNDIFRGVALGPVLNFSSISSIWGCACIEGNQINRIVVGGEVGGSVNASIATRTGSHMAYTMSITPEQTDINLDGTGYISVAASTDLFVDAHITLIYNRSIGFVEGDVAGSFKMINANLATFSANSLQAYGQLNWHFGSDYQFLQGMLAMQILGQSSSNTAAGFYVGINAPKSRAWVLSAADPLYALEIGALPDQITGFYGFFKTGKELNLGFIDGGYEYFVGLGMFTTFTSTGANSNIPGLPVLVGNLGGEIWGEILWGFVSASAGINLQVIGPYPPSFHGRARLKGCVAWVACKTLNLDVGLNVNDGFYWDY